MSSNPMNNVSITGELGDVSSLITKSISAHLESIITRHLREQTDAIISQVAKELAEATAVNVKSWQMPPSGFDLAKVQVQLIFNNESVKFIDK